jgi:hypothetical protein
MTILPVALPLDGSIDLSDSTDKEFATLIAPEDLLSNTQNSAYFSQLGDDHQFNQDA